MHLHSPLCTEYHAATWRHRMVKRITTKPMMETQYSCQPLKLDSQYSALTRDASP